MRSVIATLCLSLLVNICVAKLSYANIATRSVAMAALPMLSPAAAMKKRTIRSRMNKMQRKTGGGRAHIKRMEILKSPRNGLIGTKGNQTGVRVVKGGSRAAKALFKRLRKGGMEDTPDGFNGTRILFKNGDSISLRNTPHSPNSDAAIDVNIKGINIKKIHFPRHNTRE